MAAILALLQRIFVYDVAVEQLLGLHRVQNLLLILYNQRLFAKNEVITGFGCT